MNVATESPPAFTVKVHRWPIKTREKVPTGKTRIDKYGKRIVCTRRVITRTKEALETKAVLVRFVPNGTSRPSRVMADFGISGWYDFSLSNGNGIGSLRLTWQLDAADLKMLRRIRDELWPPPKKEPKDEPVDRVDEESPGTPAEGTNGESKQRRRRRRDTEPAPAPEPPVSTGAKVLPFRPRSSSPDPS